VFLSYVLSFIYVGIYWKNHHHFAHLIHEVTGGILWANLGLLFFLSLIPFTTAWGRRARLFAAAHRAVRRLAAHHRARMERPSNHGDARAGQNLGAQAGARHRLEKQSLTAALPRRHGLAFVAPVASYVLYALVAALRLAPDRRIERFLKDRRHL
jgi:uncharacterized membrane protein